MKEWLTIATQYSILLIDAMALVLIVIGTIEAFFGGIRLMLFHRRRPRQAGRHQPIHRRRPVLAFGNSDGDQQMLEWTAAGTGARFLALVHHTDAEREWSYDRKSPVGKLDKAWDEAVKRGWLVVDMKRDWKVIYPFEK